MAKTMKEDAAIEQLRKLEARRKRQWMMRSKRSLGKERSRKSAEGLDGSKSGIDGSPGAEGSKKRIRCN